MKPTGYSENIFLKACCLKAYVHGVCSPLGIWNTLPLYDLLNIPITFFIGLKLAGISFSTPSTQTWPTVITHHAECNHLWFSFTELRANNIFF